MHIIKAHSIPIKDVINDLAKEMGTTFSKSCEEYTLEIPKSYGSGTINGINFRDGLGLLFYDCTFHEDIEIRFIVNQIHPLKFLFCESGGFSHSFEDEKEQHTVEVLQNIIVSSCEYQGHILRFRAGAHTVVNSLEINRELFVENMDCEIKSLDKVLENLFMDVKAKNKFYFHGDYSLQMADLFTQINSKQLKDFNRNIFLHSSAYKLLSVQILEYHDSKNAEGQNSLLKKRDQLLIREAAAFIENDILGFVSVKDLGERVGLNSSKLQSGFKEIYGVTVNEFVQNRRLDLAKNLINNTDLTFSEIGYLVGLSSKSYFSKIFKDRYNITPSEIRNKNKKERN